MSAHAAMKYLVPLARANAQGAQQFASVVTRAGPTTSRDVGLLYEGWRKGTAKTRELILASPHLYLQAHAVQQPAPSSVTESFLKDLGALGGIARRAYRALQQGLMQQLLESERQEVNAAFEHTNADLQRLIHRLELENKHDR
jgi:hypothetical protein